MSSDEDKSQASIETRTPAPLATKALEFIPATRALVPPETRALEFIPALVPVAAATVSPTSEASHAVTESNVPAPATEPAQPQTLDSE